MSELAEDEAAEQLYDELLARIWSIRALVPGVIDHVPDARSFPRLRERTMVVVASIRRGDPAAQSLALQVRRLLWSCGQPPEPTHIWWATPLGRVLAPTSQQAPGAAA